MTLSPWTLLFLAIVFEVIATSCLNASQGMTRWSYGIAAMIGYSFCFWCLAFAMTRIPVGVVYAIWSGIGIVAIATIGWLVFRQSLNLLQVGFIILILIGSVGLNITSKRTVTPSTAQSPGQLADKAVAAKTKERQPGEPGSNVS